jgi:hypothetical protein
MRMRLFLILCLLAGVARAEPPDKNGVAKIGSLDHPAITESSGVVGSRKYPGIYWTHNDKGNLPNLFAIDDKGKLIAEFRVSANNDDWEDIATDDVGNLYIGRIGNNEGRFDEVTVYRIPEPDMERTRTRPGRAAPDKTWRIKYPTKPFDAESLFIHKGFGYVIDKRNDGKNASLYRFPLEGAEQVTLEQVTTLPIDAPVTAADISADGNRLAVLCTEGLYLFTINGDPSAVGKADPVKIRYKDTNIEGCCFTPNGILVTSESRQVYLFTEPSAAGKSE